MISSDTMSFARTIFLVLLGRKKSMNKYSVSPKMPHSGAPAIFMNLVYNCYVIRFCDVVDLWILKVQITLHRYCLFGCSKVF